MWVRARASVVPDRAAPSQVADPRDGIAYEDHELGDTPEDRMSGPSLPLGLLDAASVQVGEGIAHGAQG